MRVIRRDQGLSLLELVVAILVLALGTLAVVRATTQSRIAIAGTQDRIITTLAANNRAELIQMEGGWKAMPDSVRLAGHDIKLTVAAGETVGGLARVEIIAQLEGGAGVRRVIYLSGDTP